MNRKEQIVSEAKKLFFEKGYSSTSMRTLADAVGMEAASLYNHFRSKEEILGMICFDKARLFTNRMEEIEASNLDHLQKIDELIDLHISAGLEDPPGFGVFLNDWYALTGTNKEEFARARSQYEARFVQIIRQAMYASSLHSGDPYLVFSYLINAVHWVYRLPQSPYMAGNPAVLKADLKRMVFEGISLTAP